MNTKPTKLEKKRRTGDERSVFSLFSFVWLDTIMIEITKMSLIKNPNIQLFHLIK
jgi:hypothetical protein